MSQSTRKIDSPYRDEEVQFSAAFTGPAVDSGRMHAKLFAPSLFAMAELVEASAEAVYSRGDGVSLQVRANFREGSFEFDLGVAAVIGHQVLTNLSLSDLDLLLGYVGLKKTGGPSLLSMLRLIGDRPIERVEPQRDGRVTVVVQGGIANITFNQEGAARPAAPLPPTEEIRDVPANVARLLTNDRVRQAVPDVVAPLTHEGIESFRIGDAEEPTETVRKADLPKYQAPPPLKRELADDVAVTALELLSPNFVDGNKWRVSQGGSPFWVLMLDQDFLAGIDRGEQGFFKGDYLVVEMRTRVYATGAGLMPEREVIRVIEYQRRARQSNLFE